MAGPNIGFATLSVIPSAKGFRSALAGQVGPHVDDVGKESGGRFGKAFAAASKVALGGAVAGIGIGIKGLIDATGFERQMNEVFTLLPGLSGEAMDRMSGQVKDFSKDFGVLPNEVVPALYQSISAGIPSENVFTFLETAQQAAKGGVTDLTTAVDGISSVVNAYGDEVIDAAEASDLIFTAVKLGKTDVEQLSSSLFNVIPTAAGLGVEFGDITAALAAMTAQGVPTSVATTQLRQLFVELSKEGGTAATTFEDLAGKSFKDFIAAGGNTAEALGIMLEGAEDLDVGVNDLFGSVEAGSAALSLAGSETFVSNIDAMGDSAGATKTAFEQMETGLGPIMDRVKAHLSVASIAVGEWLAPFIEAGLASLSEWWGANGETITGALDTIGTFFRDTIAPALGDAAAAMVSLVQEGFQGLSNWWDTNGETITEGFEAFGEIIKDPVLAAFSDLWGEIDEHVLPILGDLAEWLVNEEATFVAFGVLVGVGLTTAMTVYAISAFTAAAATIAATWPILLAVIAVAALAGFLYYAYENWGWFATGVGLAAGGIWSMIKGVSVLIDWLETAWDWAVKLVETLDNVKVPSLPGLGGGFSLGDLLDLPSFAGGGVMPGTPGVHSLAWVAGGETILPTHEEDFSLPAGYTERSDDLEGLVVVMDRQKVGRVIRSESSEFARRNG